MITIGELKITKKDKQTRLECSIEMDGTTQNLWIEVENKYGKYLVKDRCDGFLIAMLPIAMRRKKDIICNSPVSEELLHNISTQLIPTIAKNGKNLYKTRISADINTKPIKDAKGVGTGLSRRLNSMHAIAKYLEPKYPSLKLTHLCLNNIGTINLSGDIKKDEAKKIKEECHKKSLDFAMELGLPVVVINSNYSTDFDCSYLLNSNYCNLFPIFCMQKLWKTYYYGSNHDFSEFRLKGNDMISSTHYELLLTNCLSTSNLKIYSEGAEKNRLEKTEDILDFEPARTNLHVCDVSSDNCNKCIKCMRTLLTLDAIDGLEKFKNSFDIDYYKHNKKRYLNYLINCHEQKDEINEPTYQIFKKRGWLIESAPAARSGATPPPIKTAALVVKNLTTEKTIYEKQPDLCLNSTGFAKIMTAILGLESGRTQTLINLPPKLFPGIDKATMFDLINILMVTINNPVANIIAEETAGSVDEFILMMNNKAKELGMKNTHFSKTTGMHADDYTTVRDAEKLVIYAFNNNHFFDIFKKTSYTLKYGEKELHFSTNNGLRQKNCKAYAEECIGSKFGACGNWGNTVSLFEKNKEIYLAILMGTYDTDEQERKFLDARNLFRTAAK